MWRRFISFYWLMDVFEVFIDELALWHICRGTWLYFIGMWGSHYTYVHALFHLEDDLSTHDAILEGPPPLID